ncbi:MAG: hypothetical protein MZU95_01530 [Desulfomicrobium escambiense]|nr:hypothetical protein [Desulfomicrobium escambiense]
MRPVLAAVFRPAAACLVVGRIFRDELASQRTGRVFVLPKCVDFAAGTSGTGRPEGDPVRVLFLSNIEESKGIDIARAGPPGPGREPG